MKDIAGLLIDLAEGKLTAAVPLLDALREAGLREEAQKAVSALANLKMTLLAMQRKGPGASQLTMAHWRDSVWSEFWHLMPGRDEALKADEVFFRAHVTEGSGRGGRSAAQPVVGGVALAAGEGLPWWATEINGTTNPGGGQE